MISIASEALALVWVFGWVAFFLLLRMMALKKHLVKLELIHRERIAALEKGVPMPELPDYDVPSGPSFLARLSVNPRWPLGLGALLVTTGIGVCAALVLSGDPYHQQVWSMGLIGVFLGVGFFLYYALTRPRNER